MKRFAFAVVVFACAAAVFAAEAPTVRPLPTTMPAVERKGETVVKETWDWAKEMIPVARKFTGTEGMVILPGRFADLRQPVHALGPERER